MQAEMAVINELKSVADVPNRKPSPSPKLKLKSPPRLRRRSNFSRNFYKGQVSNDLPFLLKRFAPA